MFYEISALISPKYFANGESILQTVCTEISNWPSLSAGECYQLPLLDTVFQTYIPSLTSANTQQMQRSCLNYVNVAPVPETENQNATDIENNDNMARADLSNYSLDNCTSIDDSSEILCNASNLDDLKKNKRDDYDAEELVRRSHSQLTLTKSTIVLSSTNEIDIFRSLCSVLPYTHILWELVLTAEPIVVMAASPNDCSHMVQTLSR